MHFVITNWKQSENMPFIIFHNCHSVFSSWGIKILTSHTQEFSSFIISRCKIWNFCKTNSRSTTVSNMEFIFGHTSVFTHVIHKFFNAHFTRIRNEGNMRIDLPSEIVFQRCVRVHSHCKDLKNVHFNGWRNVNIGYHRSVTCPESRVKARTVKSTYTS